MSSPSVLPSREEPIVRSASAVIGGPAGRRVSARQRSWWTVARILVALSMVVMSLAVVQKQHCRSVGWDTPDMFFHACYSDLPVVYEQTGLASGQAPYAPAAHEHYLQQPVLTGLVMWGVAHLVPDRSVIAQDRWYFDLWTILIALCLAGLVLVTVASARGRPWDAAHVAMSPLLVPLALVAPDLLGVFLASAGLLAWSRRRPVVAGVLLGLAISARTYPLLLLFVLGVLSVRAGKLRQWAATAVVAALTVVVVVLPWLMANADGVLATYRDWRDSAAGYGSPWLIPGLWGPSTWWHGHGPPAFLATPLTSDSVTGFAVAGWVVALVAGAVLAFGAPRRPRVAQVAVVVIGIVLLTGKSFPVQDSLWLLPLVALAHPRWRDHLAWFVGEAVYFVAVWLYAASSSTPTRGLPGRGYVWLLVVRLIIVAALVVLTWREAWRPERDVVRQLDPAVMSSDPLSTVTATGPATGPVPVPVTMPAVDGEVLGVDDPLNDPLDDPLGGPLDGAPDRLIVRFG